jgi:hypothetical protein
MLRFRSGNRIVDQDSQGYEFCACGTGMTDVSLPIFAVKVQKRRMQMIDDEQRPIDGGGVHLRARHIGTNSFGWDHLGTKTPGFMAENSGFSGVRTIESS